MTQPLPTRGVFWMDIETPLSPGARLVWDRAMTARGALGGTVRPAPSADAPWLLEQQLHQELQRELPATPGGSAAPPAVASAPAVTRGARLAALAARVAWWPFLTGLRLVSWFFEALAKTELRYWR